MEGHKDIFGTKALLLWYHQFSPTTSQWASYQIRKIAGCACAGNAGNVFPRRRFQRKPLVSDPGMHHGTCVTHVPWCMSGSLTRGDRENVPGIPGACAPTILPIWQEAHRHYIACPWGPGMGYLLWVQSRMFSVEVGVALKGNYTRMLLSWWCVIMTFCHNFDLTSSQWLSKDSGNASALAIQLPQACTKPSICFQLQHINDTGLSSLPK